MKISRFNNPWTSRTLSAVLLLVFMAAPAAGLPRSPRGDILAPEEREWLSRRDGVLVIGFDPRSAPAAFFDRNGIFSGIASDYTRALEKKLNCRFRAEPRDDRETLIRDVKAGRVDLLFTTRRPPDLSEHLFFTRPLLEIPHVIVTRTRGEAGDLTLFALSGMNIAVIENSVMHDYLETTHGHLKPVPVSDGAAGLRKVSLGVLDAMVIDLASASRHLPEQPFDNLTIAGTAGPPVSLTIASRKDSPILDRILGKGLDAIRQKERDAIHEKWLSAGERDGPGPGNAWVLILVGTAGVLALLACGRVMGRRGRECTRQLHRELMARERAEKAVRDGDARLRQVIDLVPDMVFVKDREGRFLLVNRAAAESLDATVESLTGKRCADVHPDPDQVRRMLADDRTVLESGAPLTIEEESYLDARGRTRRLRTTRIPYVSPGDSGPAVLGLAEDVTRRGQEREELRVLRDHLEELVAERTEDLGKSNEELRREIADRKQAEEVLRTNKTFLESIFESIQDGIIVLDKDFTIRRANGMMKRWYWKALPLEGKKCHMCIHDSDKPCADCPTVRCFESGLAEREIAPGPPGSPIKWVELFSFPIKEGNSDEVTSVVAFFRNITDREQAEEALRKSEEKFREFVEGANDLVTRVDGAARLLYVNSRAKKYYGLEPAECIGRSAFDFVHPGDLEATKKAFAEWPREKATRGTLKNRQINKKTGEVHHLLWSVNLHYDEAGEATFINSMARDLTEREHTDEQLKILLTDLERVNKELQHFAYVVSHDLKAPLRGIISVANWLHEDYADVLDDAGRGYLDKLTARARRMHNLIDGILAYSRAGRVEADPRRLDSGGVVRKVIDAVSPPENIRVRIEDPLPTVVYDKILLGQLLQNLISNAIRHLDKPEGEVVVSCEDKESFWEFCVRDNGVGIEERHFDKIFKIFQSLKPGSDLESTGIGLALVKKIAERNGGVVRVESAVDEGSAFFFTIPKKEEPEKGPTDCVVLIIDDDKGFSDVAAAILERKGCHVLHAANGREAREILKNHPREIHAALFDVIIPDEDPLERYDILRRLRPDMKIIVCTGRSVTGIVEDLVARGVDGVLKKPFRINELYEQIHPGP